MTSIPIRHVEVPAATLPFTRSIRTALLRARANEYVETALRCALREYPHASYVMATGPGPIPSHRERHPAFFGSFDWHSCVEMHWVVVRLLTAVPEAVSPATATKARATLGSLLTPEHLAAEVRYVEDPSHRSFERPYGWGWLLTLAHELATWDDADGRRWSAAVAPLADLLGARLAAWLPHLTYPQRTGLHPNTAFALSRSLDWALGRAAAGDGALLGAIRAAAERWFAEDAAYPIAWEPSGADFLSAGLCEAELMSRIMTGDAFSAWLDRFLPGLERSEPASLFWPVTVGDASDGQMAHLHGLHLSRAWAFVTLAERLPTGDARVGAMLAAAERQAGASLGEVCGSDYMVEHWLAAYATLLLG